MKTGKIPGTVSFAKPATMRSGAKIVIPINGMQSISSVEKLTGEEKALTEYVALAVHIRIDLRLIGPSGVLKIEERAMAYGCFHARCSAVFVHD